MKKIMLDEKAALQAYCAEAEDLVESTLNEQKITEVIIPAEQIMFENNGESVFMNVTVSFKDGQSSVIRKNMIWHTSNPQVAVADGGRILAIGKGEAVITLSCGGINRSIIVIVERDLDLAELSRQSMSELSSDREKIISRAKEMIEISWNPIKDLKGWKHKFTFVKQKPVTGIPYSQTDYQTNTVSFKKSITDRNFYSEYEVRGTKMPRFGNDCSGFVSFAWGIGRNTTAGFVEGILSGKYDKVGSYNPNAPEQDKLLNSYAKLQSGDALVKRGHTFLVLSNDTAKKTIIACEQTPYKAVYTVWSYAKMADGKYMPFKLPNLVNAEINQNFN